MKRRDIDLRYWHVATKFDAVGAKLADGHYSRRKPGSPQFMPPGQTIVLVSMDETALFGWWRPDPRSGITAMNGYDAWTCTIFRNTGSHLSSLLVLDAERAIGALGHGCGPDGLLTYVWPARIRSSNPGFCFLRAGWRREAGARAWSADGRKRLLRKAFKHAGTLICTPVEVTE